MARFVIGMVSEIPPGSRRIVTVARRSIGVFNVGGRFYAIKNVCPHQGAPLCEGQVTGTTRTLWDSEGPRLEWCREGEVIRCPWHAWEFDLTNGDTIFASRNRVRAYAVSVESADGAGETAERAPSNVPDDSFTSSRLETFPVETLAGRVVVEVDS
jgi:nitrite reductase/ring-hydroxylating ferredoxin subunit